MSDEKHIQPPRCCPHCGRPFVDMQQYGGHVRRCEKERQEKLDKEWERKKLTFEKELHHTTKQTVVATIGGTVEGRPTQTINYLQRLRELMRNEERYHFIKKYVRSIEWLEPLDQTGFNTFEEAVDAAISAMSKK